MLKKQMILRYSYIVSVVNGCIRLWKQCIDAIICVLQEEVSSSEEVTYVNDSDFEMSETSDIEVSILQDNNFEEVCNSVVL